ncbi:MAG: hypothetical protein HY482_01135 [Candidatus Wildermuthbacteria bacterium]|nr:hypothetical protein [Candidatus Wildermuthbacteria bacterium]
MPPSGYIYPPELSQSPLDPTTIAQNEDAMLLALRNGMMMLVDPSIPEIVRLAEIAMQRQTPAN